MTGTTLIRLGSRSRPPRGGMLRGLALWGVTLLIPVSGCGVPSQRGPHAVDSPPRLIRTGTPTPSPTTARQAELYLVRKGRLVRTTRAVGQLPGAERVLADLAAGPTPAEAQAGLASAMAGTGLVAGVAVDNGNATVALARDGTRPDQVLAFGQIVCTLTRLPGIKGVMFTRAGATVAVPRPNAPPTVGPLKAVDYAVLVTA